MNYSSFLSSLWIANLGVVPLFLFSAFLVLPWLFFLFLRIIRNFFVNEPINTTSKYYFKFIRISFLILCVLFVKDNSLAGNAAGNKVLLLARGQQKELKLNAKLKKYSIGNKEILSLKVLSKQKILIKGRKMGFTDIKIWTQNGQELYSFYVLSKYDHLKKQQFIEILDHYQLKIKPIGKKVLLEGEIKNLAQYQKIIEIISQSPSNFVVDVQLTPELSSKIKGLVYRDLFAAGSFEHQCHFKNIQLWCHYPEQTINKDIQTFLSKKFNVQFHSIGKKNRSKNYQAVLFLISNSSSLTDQWQLGVSPLNSTVKDVWLNKNYQTLVDKNSVSANSENSKGKILVKQEFIFKADKKVIYELGAEIPYQQSNGFNTTTQWRFAGLKIELELTWKKNRPSIAYAITLNQPQQETIAGSKEVGELYIPFDQSVKLFKLSYTNSTDSISGLPIVSKVPILKQLFGSNANQNMSNQIMAILAIKEVQHEDP